MRKIIKTVMIILTTALCLSFTPATAEDASYSKYKADGKYGLIDQDKKVVLPAIYDEIQYNEVYFCVSEINGTRIYDSNLQLLHVFDTDSIKKVNMIAPNLFHYQLKDGWYKWNILNIDTKEVIPLYDSISGENNLGEPWIAATSGFYSYDFQERAGQFLRANPYRNSRAIVTLGWNKEVKAYNAAVIDENFNTVIDGIYAASDLFSEGLLSVILFESLGDGTIGKKSYYIDLNGNKVYPCDFEFKCYTRGSEKNLIYPEVFGTFNEGMAVAQKEDGNWVILDRDFNHFYLPKGFYVETAINMLSSETLQLNPTYKSGLLLISKYSNGTYFRGFADKNCNIVIPCEYEYAEPFDGNYAIVQKAGVDGVVDTQGNFTPVSELIFN